ncbi:PLD-like domain-containing protein [Halorubrum ezzemoulense]|uniref:PLD-like domain-containing protein n=1 Tax=Halorubrum ezzemoulense TaxID=337243 RepID=A0A238Y2U9_HALEZ|nr:phospholipase D-like domain-containing protein [Halorubrum ezzemoulense]SNR65340.1 PLD-like domain-containing protein [Halorubrum ezzemoulense]
MPRAFSLTSESLGYLIGYTLLHADRVAIVSPWVSDVDLRFPVNNQFEERTLSLLDTLDVLPDTEVTFVVQSGEEHNNFVRDRLPDDVSLLEVDDLHAKLVVCDEFVYLGSANITWGGLKLNREVCEVIENDYGNVEAYLDNELEIRVPDPE